MARYTPRRMSQSERLHALDAVRGFALLLGVALHGANAYVANFPWIVADEPSTTMAVTVYVIHVFRMTVFFLIAGFFAHLAFHRKGQPAFVRDRLMRVGVPLVAGWFVLMPAMGLASALAVVVANGGTPPAWAAPGPAPGGIVGAVASGFPWGHLWFLYMLLGFYVLALAGRAIVERVDRRRVVERAADRVATWLVRSHVAPFVLGAPVLALYLSVPEPTRWFSIPSPILGLVPDALSSTAFGVTFLFGWVLHRQPDLVRVWERRWALNTLLAAISTGACLAIGGPHLLVAPTGGYTATAIHAVVYVVAIWTWTFAVMGAALRFLSAYRAGIRYLADASYWVYLVHAPVVMVIHVVLTLVGWPPLLKFLVVITVATAVCLATYQIMVRHTLIGLVLNGRRGGTGVPDVAHAPAPVGAAVT